GIAVKTGGVSVQKVHSKLALAELSFRQCVIFPNWYLRHQEFNPCFRILAKKWLNKPTPYCCRTTTTEPPGQSPSHVSCLFVDEQVQFILLGHVRGQLQLFKGDISRESSHYEQLSTMYGGHIPPVKKLVGPKQPLAKHSVVADSRTSRTPELQSPVVFATTEQYVMSFVLGRRDEVLSKLVGPKQPLAKHSVVADSRTSRTPELQSPVVFATTEQYVMSFVLGRRDEVLSKHWQPAIGQYWVMIGCWVQIFDQSDLGLMPDRQASRIPGQSCTVLDRFGASFDCSSIVSLTPDDLQFAVASRDAVYFYQSDGRGPCLATDGNKLALSVFKQYLVLVKGPPGLYLSHTGLLSTADNLPLESSVTLTIHDQQNKFIAGEFSIQGVLSMFIEWDGIYLLCLERNAEGALRHTLIGLTEKSTHAKLEMLFSKKNFQMAIDIAKSQHFEQEELARIFGSYADHLYKQKDYDGAIKEYVKTIGILEASFVIQRFLEGGHVTQLACYLEALNAANLASSDHLILLLNCYARLQDKTRINDFLQKPINPQMNVPAALHVLRQANFPDAALRLAQLSGRFADRIGILIEDMDNCGAALEDIAQFPFDEALRAICNYGHILMDRLPTETLQLLDKLCSQPDASRINVHHFLKVFINNRLGLMQFLERYITTSGTTVKVGGVVDALLELLLYEINRLRETQAGSKDSAHERLSQLALRLLRDDKLPYDEKKALLLCHRRAFFDGCIYLWEKQHLYDPLLKHYMSLGAHQKVLETCQKFGKELPKLWILALRYFASKPDCASELQQVVSEVDRLNLATPMVVLQILSETDAEHSCLVGTIRDYLLRHLEAGASQIAALRQGVQKLRSETMRNREVVRSLNSQVKIFQQQKCVLCHQSLEPPSVHFLCDHSYHKMCFENYALNEQSCPECAPKNKKLLAETEADVLTTGSSLLSSQVVEQLRIALHTDQTVPGEEPLEPFDNESSRSSSPQLTKLLANRLAHAPFGLSAGLPRPQTPSGVGSNAMQMTVLHSNNNKDSQSIRSRDTTPGSCGSPKPTSQFESLPTDVRSSGPRTGTATLASLRSTSLGYHSADTRSATATDPVHAIQPKNPFGDSDTDDERRSLASAPGTTQTSAKTSLPDFGFGASPKTPFDP
ncbi:vacuolar protein sorting-associated protein 11 homolog, partial [Clonorchis sinensis]